MAPCARLYVKYYHLYFIKKLRLKEVKTCLKQTGPDPLDYL